ncbi:Poly(A) polymerase central domain-containing protein, partial [Baffinella frigidus]
WKWPQPVGLTEINPNSNDLDFPVWGNGPTEVSDRRHVWGNGPTEVSDRRHVMPIITPVYPAQNATANVSKSTLKIMMDEFCRGRDIIQKIDQGKEQWSKLFEPLDSFKQYANFLQIQAFSPTHSRLPRNLLEYRSGQGAVASASNKSDYDMWKGFTEANVRAVVSYVERWPDAYVDRAHPVQRNFMKPRTGEDQPYEHYWFVGLKFDMEKLRADGRKAPNVVQPVKDFKNRLMAWAKR